MVHFGPMANQRFMNMTRNGYTHVLIPKSFHSVLKIKAKKNETSIWRYIDRLIQSKNSIEQEQPGKLVGLGSLRRLFLERIGNYQCISTNGICFLYFFATKTLFPYPQIHPLYTWPAASLKVSSSQGSESREWRNIAPTWDICWSWAGVWRGEGGVEGGLWGLRRSWFFTCSDMFFTIQHS